jgi:hypothetical protein
LSGRSTFRILELFFARHKDKTSASGIAEEFRSSLLPAFKEHSPGAFAVTRHIYEQALFLVEKDAADKGFDDALLKIQQGLYRELEGILLSSEAQRHYFAIVVPVADRPSMLRNFLESLIGQCRTFDYAGGTDKPGPAVSKKVSVYIIDDSKDPSNIRKIKEIAAEINASGLSVRYVGQKEQVGILKKVPAGLRRGLSGLIGDFEGGITGHKGASVTRNISYLYLCSRMDEFPENTLLWFIDSDEEFRVKVKSRDEIKDIHFINYFYWLDRIFAESDAEVLTGKVVGDPPVTPAVMIDTFLEDVLAFLDSVSEAKPDGPCIFHSDLLSGPFSAEYHDMTGLFGYRKSDAPKQYHCSLTGQHKMRDCFAAFSGRASGFFSGLHPTRTQFYLHNRDFLRTEQARTVYTGNYVIRLNGLRHFHPFAGLGLRMAGPTLGRILRRNLRERFVSANLPLLHKRTGAEDHSHEFRSGVLREGEMLDLSGEFVRQFWGDVTLFSVEELTGKAYPEHIDEKEIAGAVRNTEQKIWELYRHHQAEVAGKISQVKKHLEDPGRWWNLQPESEGSVRNILGFCAVVDKNFGPHSAALEKIARQKEEGSMMMKIIRAIASFQEEDRLWGEVLKTISGKREWTPLPRR